MRDVVEIVKVPRTRTDSSDRSRLFGMNLVRRVPLGGEGDKYAVDLDVDGKLVGGFITKRFDTKQDAIREVKKCLELRKAGIATHATSRFFERNGRYFALYTDETCGGTRQVWSVNNSSQELSSMGITEEILRDKIKPRLQQLGELCARKGWHARVDSYWIIKEPNGEFTVMIGDLGIGLQREYVHSNAEEVGDLIITIKHNISK